MVQPTAIPIDRPPPGHYRDRLVQMLDGCTLAADEQWPRWRLTARRGAARRQASMDRRRLRSSQLSLPLERVRG